MLKRLLMVFAFSINEGGEKYVCVCGGGYEKWGNSEMKSPKKSYVLEKRLMCIID